MADEKVIVEIGAEDKASGKINDVADKTESMGSRLKASFSGAEESSKKFALALAGIGAAAVAMGYVAFQAYNEAEAAQKQLEHAVLDVSKATMEQYEATNSLADALEKKGVLDGDNIKVGLAQLSTFGLSNDAVRGLGGSLADLAVNQFGVKASGEQLTQTANMMAKALQGQFGVLEKSGIRFTEAQQKIIMTGTEMEKVAAINEGFAQNLKYTNEVAMETGEGLQAHLMVQLGNIQEAFGRLVSEAILPVIGAFSAWLDSIGGADAVVQVILDKLAALQPYFPLIAGAIIGMLVPAFVAMAASAWAAVAPLIPFAAAGAAVAAVAYLIYEAYQTNFLGFRDAVTTVVGELIPVFQQLMDFWTLFVQQFQAMIELFKFAWENNMYGIQDIVTTVFTAIQMFFQGTWEIIKGIFTLALGIITLDWKKTWDGLKLVADGIWKVIGANLIIFWEGLQLAFKVGATALGAAWDALMNGISSVASSIWEGIKNVFKNGINAIINFVNGFLRTYNNAVGKVPGLKNLKIPEFTPLAEGGIVTRPTFALIGEAGPEAVIPLSGRNAANAGMGMTLVITGNHFYGDDDEFVEKVGDKLMKILEPHLSYS